MGRKRNPPPDRGRMVHTGRSIRVNRGGGVELRQKSKAFLKKQQSLVVFSKRSGTDWTAKASLLSPHCLLLIGCNNSAPNPLLFSILHFQFSINKTVGRLVFYNQVFSIIYYITFCPKFKYLSQFVLFFD